MADPIIQQYVRENASCDDWDPRAPEVAALVMELIAGRLPWAKIEHVGSSAVPGCAGKGIIDLQISVSADELQPVKDALEELGFQRQRWGMVWPEERPMRVGAIEHDGASFRLHVHVVPEDNPDIDVMPRFRDTLRSHPALRDAYVAWKRAIIESGQSQADEYTIAKGMWIEQVLSGQTPGEAPNVQGDA
ncbi:MAG TPA: GrpB family protein [Thermomicrobiales bacterium]|nr:GrpB family protein [Thermomicrobiales bacterium]